MSWIGPNHRNGVKRENEFALTQSYPPISLTGRTVAVGEVHREQQAVRERMPPPRKWDRDEDATIVTMRPGGCRRVDPVNPDYPIRVKERRTEGGKLRRGGVLETGYRKSVWLGCARSVGEFWRQCSRVTGDVRCATSQVREYRLRIGENLIGNIEEARHLFPWLGLQMQELHRV